MNAIIVYCDGCGRGEGPIGGKCNRCGSKIECDPRSEAIETPEIDEQLLAREIKLASKGR